VIQYCNYNNLSLLHMYKNIYAHTHKHLQINHTLIYVLYTYINAQHLFYWQGQRVCDALFHTQEIPHTLDTHY